MWDKGSVGLRHCTSVSVTTACPWLTSCAALHTAYATARSISAEHRLIAPPPDHTVTLLLILFMAIALARTGH